MSRMKALLPKGLTHWKNGEPSAQSKIGNDQKAQSHQGEAMTEINCGHFHFELTGNVNRIEDAGRFTVEVHVTCKDCGTPFRFLGLPIGLDMNGAAISPDGTEGRFAIHPVNVEVPGMPDDQPAGFRVLPHRKPR